MGKARISSHIGDGQYQIEYVRSVERLKAKKAKLEKEKEAKTKEWLDLEDDLDAAKADLDEKKAAIDEAIIAFNAEQNPTTTQAVYTAINYAQTAGTEYAKLQQTDKRLRLELIAIDKELAAIANEPETESMTAWCIDYTTTLSGDVGTIEVPLLPNRVFLKAGYGGLAEWSRARDGIIEPARDSPPSAAYYNWAMYPGYAKWVPKYRIGTITAMHGDGRCDVELDSAPFGAASNPRELNFAGALYNIDIEYMDCNEAVFAEGDRVVVEFESTKTGLANNWFQGKVIGFVDNPKSCQLIGFIFCPGSDEAWNGWGRPYYDDQDPPQAINPPLGSALGPETIGDASYRQYRLATHTSGEWEVHHNNAIIGGRRWKKRDGRVLYWDPIEGWEDLAPEGKKSAPIFYNGPILCGYPDNASSNEYTVLAVSTTQHFGEDFGLVDWIYALVRQNGNNIWLIRRPVSFDEPAGVIGPWEISDSFTLPSGYESMIASAYEHGSIDINASCTEATIVGFSVVVDEEPSFEYLGTVYEGGPSFNYWSWNEIRLIWGESLVVSAEVVTESYKTLQGLDGLDPYVSVTETEITRITWDADSENTGGNCVVAPGSQWWTNPYTASSGTTEDDILGTCEAIVSAKYIEDSDVLTRIMIKAEYYGYARTTSSRTIDFFTGDPGYYTEVGGTSDNRQTEEIKTTISVYADDTLLDSYIIWEKASSALTSSHWSWQAGQFPESVTGGGGSRSDAVLKTSSIFIPAKFCEASTQSFCSVFVDGPQLVTESQTNYLGLTSQCETIYNETGTETLTEDQEVTIKFRSRSATSSFSKSIAIGEDDDLYLPYFTPDGSLWEANNDIYDFAPRGIYTPTYYSRSYTNPYRSIVLQPTYAPIEACIDWVRDFDWRPCILDLLFNVTVGIQAFGSADYDYAAAPSYTYKNEDKWYKYNDHLRSIDPDFNYDDANYHKYCHGSYIGKDMLTRPWEILWMPGGQFVGQSWWKPTDDPISIPIWSQGDLIELAEIAEPEAALKAGGYGWSNITFGVAGVSGAAFWAESSGQSQTTDHLSLTTSIVTLECDDGAQSQTADAIELGPTLSVSDSGQSQTAETVSLT